jgi:selenocysteine lyase/cysteine desulfurase
VAPGDRRVGPQHPNINVLGSHEADRLSIVSFVIRHGPTGTCTTTTSSRCSTTCSASSRAAAARAPARTATACSASTSTAAHEFQREINRGCEGIKPGWVRVNFNYFIDDETFDYIVDAVRRRGASPPTSSRPTG